MSVLTFQKKVTTPTAVDRQPTVVSWEDFQKKYLTREDGFKYEWLNGVVEKTERTMDPTQFYIQYNLDELLSRLKQQNPDLGMFTSEGDTFFGNKHRRPDIAYYTKEQLRQGRKGIKPVPEFVVEVISKTDNINRVNGKIDNYFAAGVKIIWHVFPLLEKVYVYENDTTIRICSGSDMCSAEAVISGFALPTDAIFKEP